METVHTENTLPNESTLDFVGFIPEVYESILGDFIFEPFAQDLAARIKTTEETNILELAAGTGRVTQQLTQLLPHNTIIVATDISNEMLQVAKQQVNAASVKWQQADIADIPFDDNSFDIVVCQFGIMFLQDKIRGFSEMRRVLKPGGQLIFSVWAPIEENKIWQLTYQALMQFMGQLPAVLHKVGPFSSSYIPTVLQQLQDAGFDEAKVDTVKISSSISSARLAAKGFIHGLPIKEFILKNNPSKINDIQQALAFDFAAHLGNFPLTTSFTALVFNTSK